MLLNVVTMICDEMVRRIFGGLVEIYGELFRATTTIITSKSTNYFARRKKKGREKGEAGRRMPRNLIKWSKTSYTYRVLILRGASRIEL